MVVILINKILSLALIMMLGVLLVKLKIVKSTDSGVLSRLSLYMIMPCVIFSSFQVEYSEEVKNGLILAFIAATIIQILLLVFNAILKRPLHLDGIEQTSAIYPNAANLIVPLVSAMLGKEWVIYASGFMTVQLFALWSHGKSTICGENHFDFVKTLTNVNLIVTIIGLTTFLLKLQLPKIIVDTVDSIGSTIGPISMIITGMLIGGMDLRNLFTYKRVWLVTALRLIVVPLVILPVVVFIGNSGFVAESKKILLISFLAVTTPSASSLTQIAQVYNQDARYSSAINVMTTFFCIITIPVMVMLYQLF